MHRKSKGKNNDSINSKKTIPKREQEQVHMKRRGSSVSNHIHKLSTKSNQTIQSQTNDSRKQQNSNQNMNKLNGNIVKQRQYQADSRKLVKKQDQKAAKTLSAILLAFIITWTPYNINVVVNTFCNNCLHQFEKWDSFGNFNLGCLF
jgi:ABC-type Na+ efflux pump permease subunit